MKKVYIVNQKNKAAVHISRLHGFGGCVYAHGILEKMAHYDVVGQLDSKKYEQDTVEDVVAVLPNKTELPATLFIWVGVMKRYSDPDLFTGEVHEMKPYTRVLGLLVAKNDDKAMAYAQRMYEEKPFSI